MLDRDLAELYEVPTRVLNQAVTRNIERFPGDFAFLLSRPELEKWRSRLQFGTAQLSGSVDLHGVFSFVISRSVRLLIHEGRISCICER